MVNEPTTFGKLPIGAEFKFSRGLEFGLLGGLNEPGITTYLKISARKYSDIQGEYRVGSIAATVWRVS